MRNRFNIYFQLFVPSDGYVFKTFFSRHGKLWGHKGWEVQLAKIPMGNIFDITLDYGTKESHAGFQFELTILGIYLGITLQDNRHWDHKLDDWEVYDTE